MARNKSIAGEYIESIVVAIILAAVIRLFLFQPFYIPSGSMEPTLKPGDRIIVNKVLYRFRPPARGEVMVFKNPLDPEKDFIKRVVALGGERIEGKGSLLYINNKQLPEPYLPEDTVFSNFGPLEVPSSTFFMMGDNRNNSLDSRYWGVLPAHNVVGKAFLVFWPVGRLGLIR